MGALGTYDRVPYVVGILLIALLPGCTHHLGTGHSLRDGIYLLTERPGASRSEPGVLLSPHPLAARGTVEGELWLLSLTPIVTLGGVERVEVEPTPLDDRSHSVNLVLKDPLPKETIDQLNRTHYAQFAFVVSEKVIARAGPVGGVYPGRAEIGIGLRSTWSEIGRIARCLADAIGTYAKEFHPLKGRRR